MLGTVVHICDSSPVNTEADGSLGLTSQSMYLNQWTPNPMKDSVLKYKGEIDWRRWWTWHRSRCTQHIHVQLHVHRCTHTSTNTFAVHIHLNLFTHIYHTYIHEDMHILTQKDWKLNFFLNSPKTLYLYNSFKKDYYCKHLGPTILNFKWMLFKSGKINAVMCLGHLGNA